MPIDYKDYPVNWKGEIVPAIRRRSGDCCEGSPMFPSCRAKNGEPHPYTGSKVVLTTAHMDQDKTNNVYDSDNADAMGIDWMTRLELAQAIPPAYTKFIGKEILIQLSKL